jgi:Fur family zinc uptake transcriptional regulator
MNLCSNHDKCIIDSLDKAQEVCDKNKVRFTNLRKKIFTIILQTHQACKAYDVLSILQKEDPSAKPATIYRALDFLLEYGLIHKLHISNSYVSCRHSAEHDKSIFLICKKCNIVQEYCDIEIANKLAEISKNNKFTIQEAAIEFSGVCNICSG